MYVPLTKVDVYFGKRDIGLKKGCVKLACCYAKRGDKKKL